MKRVERITKECKTCHKFFVIPRFLTEQRHCSRKCADVSRRITPEEKRKYHRDYMRKYQSRYREKNIAGIKRRRTLRPEKYNSYMREYNKKNRDRLQQDRILRVYGLSPEEHQELLKKQNGLCAICKKCETVTLKGVVKNLAVDHCHGTGKVRGLLCQRCNQAIGLLMHDKELLSKALEYLAV